MKCRGKLNFKEILAKLVQDTLGNGVRFEQDKHSTDTDGADFIAAVKIGEPDLFRKLKGAEKLCSIYGHYFAQFELWYDKIKINIAPDSHENRSIRTAGGEPFAVSVKLTWYRSLGNELTTLENYTNVDCNRIVMVTGTKDTIQNGVFVVQAPEFIRAHNNQGLFIHDYGVIPAREFLNKNDLEFYPDDVEYLADGQPAASMLDMINHFLFTYMDDEMDLDTTKIIGNLTYQDVHSRDLPSSKQLGVLLKNGGYQQEEWYKARTGTFTAGEEMLKKLIVRTPGGDTSIEKMQSTFDGTKHMDAFMKMLNNAFEICGYSGNKNDGSQNYDNTASIMNVNKTIYATTKMKKIQREEDGYKFFEDMAAAYFKKVKMMDDITAKIKASDIKKHLKFEIISNMINDFLKSDERVLEIYSHGLMSDRKAIELLNPDMSEEDINNELNEVQNKQKMEHEQAMEMMNEVDNASNSQGNGDFPQKNDKEV